MIIDFIKSNVYIVDATNPSDIAKAKGKLVYTTQTSDGVGCLWRCDFVNGQLNWIVISNTVILTTDTISSIKGAYQGQLGIDIDNKILYFWNGSDWLSITSNSKDEIPVVSINIDNAVIEANTVYSITIDKDINFILPTLNNGTFAQILVCAKVISDVNIDFGTTHFFNDEIPTIESNANYDILFEHDPIENVWVCGAIKKG